jgi:hypothetical protein
MVPPPEPTLSIFCRCAFFAEYERGEHTQPPRAENREMLPVDERQRVRYHRLAGAFSEGLRVAVDA